MDIRREAAVPVRGPRYPSGRCLLFSCSHRACPQLCISTSLSTNLISLCGQGNSNGWHQAVQVRVNTITRIATPQHLRASALSSLNLFQHTRGSFQGESTTCALRLKTIYGQYIPSALPSSSHDYEQDVYHFRIQLFILSHSFD